MCRQTNYRLLNRIGKAKAFLLLSLIGLAVAGSVFVFHVWSISMKAYASQTLMLAEFAEAGFQKEAIGRLEGSTEDIGNPAYTHIKNSLMKLVETNTDLRFAYIYKRIDGKLYIIADSEAPDSVDYSPPGQEYTEAMDIYMEPFDRAVSIITGPVTDRWGTWVSVLVPMKDIVTGEVIAVFGLDYPAALWNDEAVQRTIQAVVVIICLFLLLLAFYGILSKNMAYKDEKNKLALVNMDIATIQNRLQRAQSMAQVGNWELDIASRQVWASEEAFRIYGIKQEEPFLPLELIQQIPCADERPRLDRALRLLLEKGEKYDLVFRIKRLEDGAERVIHSSAILELDKNGKPYKVIGVVQDVTEYKLAQQKISEQEELFRAIFEQSPIGITFGRASGEIINVNPAFVSIVGRTKEELAVVSWESITHPDDVQEDMERLQALVAGETEGYSMNKRYIRPDGSIVWVNITVVPLRINNHVDLEYLCLVEDISERIHAEKELRESERSKAILLSNLPGMAYRCSNDKDWTMHFISEGCYALTGYKPGSLLENTEISFSELIMPEYRESLRNKWNRILPSDAVFKAEYAIKTALGETKWVFEQGRGIFDEEGAVIALEGLIIDITDRKQREEQIRYLSNHDVLTGLYNRRWFEHEKDRIEHEGRLPQSIIIGDINGLKLINDALGHAEGDKLIVKTAELVRSCCRDRDIIARTGGDEFCILLPDTASDTAYEILQRIQDVCKAYNKNISSEVYYISLSLGYATKDTKEEHIDKVIKTAETYMYKRKLLEHKSSHSAIISAIKTTMFERSQETKEHAERLTLLSKAIGVKLKLSQEELDELGLLATLHDIGKVGIDNQILNKKEPLTDEEWMEMKKHPEIGYRIAMASPELHSIADYILSHHEKWNGRGYPQGLKMNEIPLLSRIIAIVDAFDAMTNDRPYRKGIAKDAAVAEIKKCRGTHFDPHIAEIFIDML